MRDQYLKNNIPGDSVWQSTIVDVIVWTPQESKLNRDLEASISNRRSNTAQGAGGGAVNLNKHRDKAKIAKAD